MPTLCDAIRRTLVPRYWYPFHLCFQRIYVFEHRRPANPYSPQPNRATLSPARRRSPTIPAPSHTPRVTPAPNPRRQPQPPTAAHSSSSRVSPTLANPIATASSHATATMILCCASIAIIMPDSSASSSTGNATQYWVALLHATRPERLNEFVAQHAEAYHHAQPFPHASIDDIFPADVLRAISDEIPEVDAGTLRDERRTQADPQYLKRYIRDDTQMGVVTRLVFAVLRSPPFVDFLARLSGISGLLPDPVYAGSGVHITGVGAAG